MAVGIRGQAFLGFADAVRRIEGARAYDRMLNRLPPRVLLPLTNSEILALGWYPFEWYSDLHSTAAQTFGVGISRRAGREATRNDVRGMFRFLLRLVSPERVLQQSNLIWGLFCDTGSCTVELATRGHAYLRYSGCPQAPYAMWEKLLGTSEELLSLGGAQEATAQRVEGGGGHDTFMFAEVRWRL